MLYIDDYSSVNQAEEKFLRLTKEELHYELQIELDEFHESEDENAESIMAKDTEPEAKRPKLSIATEKTQRAKPKPKKKIKKRKNDDADKENALPKTKKAKKAEKPKRKQKVYLIAITVNSTTYIYEV
jgi:hypothetical protein